MSDLESHTPEISQAADSKTDCAELQRQMKLLLIVAALGSLMFTAFMGLQFVRASRDLDGIRQKGIQISEALKRQEAGLEGVKAKLIEYGKDHSDFVPILVKYGLKPATGAGSPPAQPAPATPPAVAPKK